MAASLTAVVMTGHDYHRRSGVASHVTIADACECGTADGCPITSMPGRSRYFRSAARSAKPLSPSPKKVESANVQTEVEAEGAGTALSDFSDMGEKADRRVGCVWQPPDNWQRLLGNIRLMRAAGGAPVDTVGCEKCVNPDASPEIRRFEVLVSLMLSSQTKDEVTHAACQRLRKAGLSPRMILDMDAAELGELIKPVGFWRKKVVYLKKVSEILMKEYGGDIPETVEQLCSLPGVGPKMSHLVMLVAWDQVTGIAVDTHVHRICNRLNFVRKGTKDPKQTERQIEDWLPRELWHDFNSLLVGLGQTICTPRNPKCHQCLNQDICPSSEVNKHSDKK